MSDIRSARFSDALLLADRLRFEDAREIAVSWGLGVREGLFHCLLQSDRAFTLALDGEPEALWGVTGRNDGGLSIGMPWMLAGDRLFRSRSLLGRSRRVLGHMLLDYDVLTNLTDASNEAHLRWLAWCGFRELRRHPRLGPAARPFVEFYRINERRGTAPEAVRAVLERRQPNPGAPSADVAGRLARAAIVVLGSRGPVPAALSEELISLLGALESGGAGPRTRRAGVRLMLELAVAVCTRPHPLERGGRGATPLGELLSALAEVADLLALGSGCDGADVVTAMVPLPPPERPRARLVQPPPMPRRGGEAFHELVRRYRRMLTLEGRVSRIQGCRLWSAAIASGAGAAGEAMPRAVVVELWRDHRAARQLCTHGSDLQPASDRKHILEQTVSHGSALAAMGRAFAGADAVGRAVSDQIDSRAVGAVATGRMRTMADAVAMAGLLADGAAQRMLPGLRFGGVVSGYADRHWLFRLIRARLLEALELELPQRALLLADDVAGLLLAGALEDGLIGASSDEPEAEETDRLFRDVLALWGAANVTDDVLAHVLTLLLPALVVPAVHLVQLQPAVVVCHLVMTGGLDDALRGVSDVAGGDGISSWPRYRRFLQSLARRVDTLTFSRFLDLPTHAEARVGR